MKHIKSNAPVFMLVAALSVGTLACSTTALGQASYPNKLVRIVVPGAPGSGTDILARLLGSKLAESWGQNVITDNRSGGSSIIASEIVARARADGYTLLLIAPTFAINVSYYGKKLPYDPIKDLVPIVLLVSGPNVLVAHPSLPVKSVKELVTLAKKRPKQIYYGYSQVASTSHLGMELFMHQAGIALSPVAYRGNAPIMIALASGEVALAFIGMPPAMLFIKTGKVRALAVSSAQRSPLAPNLPTLAETGMPGFEVTNWFGLLAPAGTPRDVINKVSADATRILHTPDSTEKLLKSLGVEPRGGTPDEFASYLRTDIERWKKAIEESEIPRTVY